MKCYHDTRDVRYRAPFGAVEAGTPVTLALDIWDAPGATVLLRTWVDGVGEARFAMQAASASAAQAQGSAPAAGMPVRYETVFTPDEAGIVWYQFVIVDGDGHERRYGAHDGRTGGEGRLVDWEPPSFRLTVLDADGAACEQLIAAEGRRFEDAVVGFLRGGITANDLVEVVAELQEDYPPCRYGAAFDLLDGCDKARLFARLADASVAEWDDASEPAANLERCGIDEWHRGMAKGRLWRASLIDMLAAGLRAQDVRPAECDGELAAQWESVEPYCGDIVRNTSELSRTLPASADDISMCFAAGENVFGFVRRGSCADKTAACVLVNRSQEASHDVLVPLVGEHVSDVIDGRAVLLIEDSRAPEGALTCSACALPANGQSALVHLSPAGSAVLYFSPRARFNREMKPGVGVLAHITSIPANGPGTLGAPARAFVDWLASAGVRYWQVLPVNPTDPLGSPYAGISAFAGNTSLLEGGLGGVPASAADASEADESAYRAFCEREADWLEPYAAFMAIRQKLGSDMAWWDWPERYQLYNRNLLAGDEELGAFAEAWRRAQFTFERQWEDLRAYANERGVQIVGDMPIYVNADSADAWGNLDIFQLDAQGSAKVVAGCPPDDFAVEGQVWGNPVYDWDALRANGYAWWMRRLERAFELYDWVRLDHFIGFARYYSIPLGEKGTAGAYHAGPGTDFFHEAFEKFGPLPIIAEDLGMITPCVRALSATCGFPGMDIVQFADGNDPLAGYHPRPDKIAYTGTHDNQTLIGYCASRYPDLDTRETAAKLMDEVIGCDAPVVVFPLQDVIGLDDAARMNTPGTTEGNWSWQAEAADVERATATLRSIVERR